MSGFSFDGLDVKVKSLYKTISLLQCFTPQRPEWGITELSKRLNLHKSNVYNIVATLVLTGYVQQNKSNSKYRLSQKMLEFSYAITSQLNYQDAVQQVIKKLSDQTGQMVYFGVPHGHNVLYMFNSYPRTEGSGYLFRSIMGETAPMYATALGKAMFSTMPDREIQTILPREKKSFTRNTLTVNAKIIEDVRKAKNCGYAIDNMEHEDNVKCVGVPVFDSNQKLLGAISVSGMAVNFTEDKIKNYASMLMDAALEIKKRL